MVFSSWISVSISAKSTFTCIGNIGVQDILDAVPVYFVVARSLNE